MHILVELHSVHCCPDCCLVRAWFKTWPEDKVSMSRGFRQFETKRHLGFVEATRGYIGYIGSSLV